MTSERDKCGLGSILPISCRDRAEAFARSLQSRLSTLGTDSHHHHHHHHNHLHQNNNSRSNSSDENSWLAPDAVEAVAITQPIHNPLAERYLTLDMSESPSSPQEEIDESTLKLFREEGAVRCNGRMNGLSRHQSGDSDEVYYDAGTNDNDYAAEAAEPEVEAEALSSSSRPALTNGFGHSDTDIDSDDIIFAIASTSDYPEDCTANNETLKTEEANEPASESVGCVGTVDVDRTVEAAEAASLPEQDARTAPKEIERESEEGAVERVAADDLAVLCLELGAVGPPAEDPTIAESIQQTTDDDMASHEVRRVRRCSSLKTGKTPPSTPNRRRVRFADVFGLDLADVRTFMDDIPSVPQSAFDDLSIADCRADQSIRRLPANYHHGTGMSSDRILMPLFEQPSSCPNFLDTVRDQLVCLENAMVEDPILFLIKGTVRVRNLDFHKSVHVRYSLDSWTTFADVQATYVDNSCDGFSDRFAFRIYANSLTFGQRIEFACRFQCRGCQYWDNNKGKNYCFQCLRATATSFTPATMSTHGLSDWGASFY